jgi:HEPN domain-containing protein
MSTPREALAVIRQWVEKAEHDLKNAEHTLQLTTDCPLDTVCFHAQQCAEKYLKALLTTRGVHFPRTHDLSELIARLPNEIRSQLNTFDAVELNPYAVEGRYPGDWEPVAREEANRAVELARRIRATCRTHLPSEALGHA